MARTRADTCQRKITYLTREGAQTHLDMLVLSQAFGGARVYECNVRNDDGSAHYHIAGHPGHVYGGREPPWKRRERNERHKKRRRNDEEPETFPVEIRRNEFVAQIAESVMGIDPHASTLFDAHLARGWNMTREGDYQLGDTDVIAGTDPAHLGATVTTVAAENEDTIALPGMDFAMVPANQIGVDMSYQRDVSPGKVNTIATALNPYGFGVIYLSQRNDGSLFALDGQHRIAAVRTKYGEDTAKKVPSLVMQGLSVDQEAAIYVLLNRNRLQPTAYDAFKARLVAGDEAARAVDRILRDRGIRLVGGIRQAKLGFDEVQAVSTLEEMYRGNWLTEVLDVIGTAWRGTEEAHRANYLKAVRVFLETFWEEFYAEDVPERIKQARKSRLIDALATLGPVGLDNRAKFYAESLGNNRVPVCMAHGIHASYNKGIRAAIRLPVWGESAVERQDGFDADGA